MKDTIHTLTYALCLGIVCAALLTGAGVVTNSRARANKAAEQARNILTVLGAEVGEDWTNARVVEEFEGKVTVLADDAGTPIAYHYPKGAAEPQVIGVPFEGAGLWGPIKGLLALEADRRTIKGISFYEQEETPGLGGEISSDDFQARFVGKSIVGPDGSAGFRVVGGNGDVINEVDAITGATETCKRVEGMLNATIARIVKGAR